MHRHTREKKKSEFARSYSIFFYLLMAVIGILTGLLIAFLTMGDMMFSRFKGSPKPDVKITDEKNIPASDAIANHSENRPPINNISIPGEISSPAKKMSLENPDKSLVVYSVQTGSYENIASARRHYDTVIQNLDVKFLDYLRIEKVGEYYSVRIGRFREYLEAKSYVNTVRPQLSEVLIIKTNLNGDRVIDLYHKS